MPVNISYHTAAVLLPVAKNAGGMVLAQNDLVPVQNSLVMAMAYADKKIPFELHVYPEAPHGIALANEITARGNQGWIKPQAARWVDDSVYFFKHL